MEISDSEIKNLGKGVVLMSKCVENLVLILKDKKMTKEESAILESVVKDMEESYSLLNNFSKQIL